MCFFLHLDGYYYEFVFPHEQGVLKPLAGKAICRKCHPRCKRCSGYGFHSQVCSECAGYKRGEQCEDECPTDHYADEVHRECFECHEECRGCFGPGAENCMQCRNFKIYEGDPNDNSTSFNCTTQCPKEYPFKVYSLDQPYCSAVSAKAGFAGGESTEAIMYMVIAIIVLFIIFAVLVISTLHCRQKAKIKKETIDMARVLVGCEDAQPLRPTNIGANLSKLNVIKTDELKRGKHLGSGAFGEVFQGTWTREIDKVKVMVAIKTLTNVDGSATNFFEEAYLMASVHHENILSLLAVCMTEQTMLITQYMANGSLLEYVKNNKAKIDSRTMLLWSLQIAKGMAYLEGRRLVHRDLAARNVLVSSPPSKVKIADFGLAKLLSNDSNEYKQAAGGKMPFKWLAIECLRERKFTTKSDVWAFGVTIWEITSFGCRPFEGVSARDLPDRLEAGERLTQPECVTKPLFVKLISCWAYNPQDRPSFAELVQVFQEFASDPGQYIVIRGDKYCRAPEYAGQIDNNKLQTITIQNDFHDGEKVTKRLSRSTPGPSNAHLNANAFKSYSLDSRAKIPDDDETDSNREVTVGNLRLDLPVDDDDYLMPTCQSETNATPGYMDLIGTPSCVDNPEYLMNSSISTIQTPSTSSASSRQPIVAQLPTQTIGIPVVNSHHPLENGEQDSDREYYNDLQRELQPLQTTNETTV